MKLTKRKGFNFFRSYFDVYNELETDKDKVAFMDALLDRQFLGIKPEGLKGMAKFAYVSQTNSIDTQVKGYEDRSKGINKEIENYDPWQGVKKTILTPCQQEKGEGEGKEKVQVQVESTIDWDKLILEFNKLTGKKVKTVNKTARKQINARLSEGYTKKDLWNAITNCFNDPYHKEHPHHLTFQFISKPDKFERWSNTGIKKTKESTESAEVDNRYKMIPKA